MVDGVNFFNQNQEIKLQNRGARSSGITFELKSVFEDLVNKGVIRDKDGKGLTKADALNLFNKLDSIHKNTNRATNYTSMQAGQSFTYSAAEMKALAEAAGYEIVNSSSSQDEAIDGGMLPEVVVTAEKPKQKIIMPELPNPAANPDDIEIEIPQELKQASTESMIERLGGKIIEREVNGEGQQIAVVEINGQKIRRVINEDGSLGDTLAATKTFGKNEYISGDFPPETRIMEREVNGQKSQIGVYEDENGNKVRRLVVTDEETGKTTLGETLVTVSTMGKNKYVTQSKFEADVRSMLGLGANDEIPSDLKAEYVTIGGESSLVIKKDGKVMDSAQIRAYMAEYKANDNRGVDAFDNSFDATGREQMGTSDNTVRDDSQNVLSKIPDAKLPDGSTWDGNVMGKQLSQDQKDANKLVYEFVRKSARFYNSKNGLYTVRGFQDPRLNFAETKAENAMRLLYDDRNDYMRLKQQEPSTLTQSDKELIKNFEDTLEKMQLQVDENGNFSNIKGSDFIRE